MMTIKAGDLVMVVKASPCCRITTSVGRIFTVAIVQNSPSRCACCHKVIMDDVYASHEINPKNVGFHVSRLIKIDPPALQETECAWKPKELVKEK